MDRSEASVRRTALLRRIRARSARRWRARAVEHGPSGPRRLVRRAQRQRVRDARRILRDTRKRDRDARKRVRSTRADRRRALEGCLPYLSLARAPSGASRRSGPDGAFAVATYNVHRWAGGSGARRWNPTLACDVIAELEADVVALQEVVRPFDAADPLESLAEELGLHLAFVSTRLHRRGELGNAILSRWPLAGVRTLDLSFGRLEKRSAIAAQFRGARSPVAVVATHLALVDRTRARQVRSLLDHPGLQGPVVLLGDLNAWRLCRATRELDREFWARHHNQRWPASFPAARPALSLDRIYSRGAQISELRAHRSRTARRASDHLPVLATLEIDEPTPESDS
jgi:endonuclease/exonuclease/phosphatase family metal-dependent hydrolase